MRTKNTTETQFQANYADNKRNLEGIFWTPFHLCELWPQLVADKFGPDWREKFVVYDPAAGGGNLTANLEIPDLVQSTLEQSDVDYMLANNINPGSVKFAADFLQLELNEIPADALEKLSATNKEILFVMNPPWKASGSGSLVSKDRVRFTSIPFYQKYPIQELAALFFLKCMEIGEAIGKPYHIVSYTKTGTLFKYQSFNKIIQPKFEINSAHTFSSKEFGLKSNFPCTLAFFSRSDKGFSLPFKSKMLDGCEFTIRDTKLNNWILPKLPRTPVVNPTPFIRTAGVRSESKLFDHKINKDDLLLAFYIKGRWAFAMTGFVGNLPIEMTSPSYQAYNTTQFEEALDLLCFNFMQFQLEKTIFITNNNITNPTRSESDWIRFRNTTAFHSIISNKSHIASYREDIHGFNHTNRLCIHGPELVEQHGNDLCRKDMEQNRHIPIAYEWLKSAAFHQSVYDYIDEYNKQLVVVLQQPETRIWDSSWRQLQSRFPDRKRLVQMRDQIREYGRREAPTFFPDFFEK